MPLILAIESDRRQATQLKAVVRGRLRADLVLADTADAALAALGNRVPDLVLTSAFLSPKDETALAEFLRALDTAAAHVQTLTIPVLDAPREASNVARGMLSVFLGDRGNGSAAPDGCDPAVFADQCAEYLERAANERVTPIDALEDPAIEQPAMAAPTIVAPPIAAAVIDMPRPMDAVEPAVLAAFDDADTMPTPERPGRGGFDIDLSSLLDESVVHELSAAIENVTASDSNRWSQPRPAPRPEKWTAVPIGNKNLWPRMEGKASESPRSLSGSAPKPRREAAGPRPRRTSATKPAQDEWGLFDPAQCGFATLLAKLDEITQVASPLPAVNIETGSLDVNR